MSPKEAEVGDVVPVVEVFRPIPGLSIGEVKRRPYYADIFDPRFTESEHNN
jgi:hypothetical protein